jgi:hypothetical protein
MEQVTLIADIQLNTDNTASAFTTKLARPLNLPGLWRATIMDISYPHQWSNIHHDWTYAVLVLSNTSTGHIRNHNLNVIANYLNSNNYILDEQQPRGPDKPSAIITTNTGENKNEIDLFNDVTEIGFSNTWSRYLLYIETIEENKNSNLMSIISHIRKTIRINYRQQYPQEEDCDDIVTYDPKTRKVTFKNLEHASYLIVAPAASSVISMLGHKTRSYEMTMSSKRSIQVLIIDNMRVTNVRNEIKRPLPAVEEINLKTLDNVFIYSDIIEQSLIGESQGNLLGYFPIKSQFGETGYWCFNPPYEYRVIKNWIDTISIKLTALNGELFPFKKGQIIIRLLFKRV